MRSWRDWSWADGNFWDSGVQPLFGINLFIPRLVEFLAQNPELDINVTYANHRSYSSEPATGRAITASR